MGLPLDSIAHVIQVALTPAFLLSAIGSLLNVITVRLGRVAGQSDVLVAQLRTARGGEAVILRARATRLRRRLRALDAARAFGTLAGAAICAATFALFLGALQNAAVAAVLTLSFGTSILCTAGSLMGYLMEGLLSSRRSLPATKEDA